MRQAHQVIAPLVSATEQFYENGLEQELASLRELYQAEFEQSSIVPQQEASPYRACEEVNQLLAQSYWLLADTPEFERLERWFDGTIFGPGERKREEFLVRAACTALLIMQRFGTRFPQGETIEEARLPPRLLGLYKHQASNRPEWPIRRLVALSAVLKLSPAELCFDCTASCLHQAWQQYWTQRWSGAILPTWAVYDMHAQSSIENICLRYRQQVPPQPRRSRQ